MKTIKFYIDDLQHQDFLDVMSEIRTNVLSNLEIETIGIVNEPKFPTQLVLKTTRDIHNFDDLINLLIS